MFETNFATLDWVIVLIYLLATGIVGVMVNKYVSSASDYLVGGAASGTSLSIATFIGTGLGLVTLMYASQQGFTKGFAYMALGLIGMLVSLLVGGSGFVISKLRELNLMTIPEYYEKRFDKKTRVTGGIICAVAGILNMGLFPKMGATFLTYSTGLAAGEDDHEFMINIITSVLIVLVLLYTVAGGMVAVIVTDYIQFVVLSIGMGLGLYFCFSHPDLGFKKIMQVQADIKGESAFNPFHQDSYGWTFMCWMLCMFVLGAICWAPEASRALICENPKTAKKTFLLSAPGQFARLAIPALWAIAAFAFFTEIPELSHYFFPDGPSGASQNTAQAMPLFLGKIVPTGLLGILVAGLMAAFMSTHDSYLLCWSSVISNDIVGPLKQKPLTDNETIKITRISVVLIGLFLLIWGVWYKLPDSVWAYIAVTGTIYISGAGIVLIGGMYWKKASSTGALATLLSGLLAIGGLFVKEIKEFVPWVSDAIFGLGTYLFCAVVFVVFSLLFPDKNKTKETI